MLLGPFRTSLCVGSKTLRHRHHNGRNGVTRIQMPALVRGLPSTRPDEPPSDTCIKVYGKTRLPLLKISYYLSPAWLGLILGSPRSRAIGALSNSCGTRSDDEPAPATCSARSVVE
jgi:hypothetical protein